jgi:hypothetical protein
MKANELRIGNVLETRSNTKGWIRYEITGLNIYQLSAYGENFKKDVRPIRTTEDLLLECGCVLIYKSDYSIILTLSDKHDIFIKRSKVLGWRFVLNGFIKHFDYLHELQNLYFTLTGDELKINTQGNEKN